MHYTIKPLAFIIHGIILSNVAVSLVSLFVLARWSDLQKGGEEGGFELLHRVLTSPW